MRLLTDFSAETLQVRGEQNNTFKELKKGKGQPITRHPVSFGVHTHTYIHTHVYTHTRIYTHSYTSDLRGKTPHSTQFSSHSEN